MAIDVKPDSNAWIGSEFPVVRDLADAAARRPEPVFSSEAFEPEGPSEIDFNPEFERALGLIESGDPVVFITGRAGTGKSTLVHHFRETTHRNLAIVAPTGVAALGVRGQTIHSFFRLPPRPVDPEEIRRVRDRTLYEKLDVLLVDEVSMVRADLLDAMDRFLRANTGRQSAPFGGVQMVFVGDLFQLPPVVATEEEAQLIADRYGTPWFFSAESLHECRLAAVELEKVYRQQDGRFLGLLNAIREGRDALSATAAINDACYRPSDVVEPGAITLTCTNRAANALNDTRLVGLPDPPRTFFGSMSGQFRVQQQQLPAPFELTLKVGAQVMFTKNDSGRRWVNGTVGVVTSIEDETVLVQVEEQGFTSAHEVRRETWESVEYDYDRVRRKVVSRVIGEYRQLPLMLAWAVTIHKAQGKTLDRVEIDLGRGAFADGQLYVALSRCRSVEGIRLRRPICEGDVRCAPEVVRFYEALRSMPVCPLPSSISSF